MHSPHLVELLGYCADQSHRLLVFEFHAKRHPQEPPAPRRRRGGEATGAGLADAAVHRAGLRPRAGVPAVIHSEFNCGNVLLDHNCRTRVSDFATAKVGSNKANGQVLTRVLGTTGYLAPE
ncbi:hypothetical protein ACQ4PT_010295 [Festuca glaucescens]